jgi:hypothetical protein
MGDGVMNGQERYGMGWIVLKRVHGTAERRMEMGVMGMGYFMGQVIELVFSSSGKL